MEALSKYLQPHRRLVAIGTSIITFAQFFTGAFVCKKIHESNSTAGISAKPFLFGLIIRVLTIKYSIMLQNKGMFAINTTAIFFNWFYLSYYYAYTTEDAFVEIFAHLTGGGVLIALMLAYSNWEDPSLVSYRYGFLLTFFKLVFAMTPVARLHKVIEQEDASSISLILTFTSFITSSLWLVYGIILLNNYMIMYNLFTFSVNAFKLFLVWLYPGKNKMQDSRRPTERKLA